MTVRDPSSSPAQRICPSCGHANSGISLFCAECGAVLNGASMDDAGDATDDAQHTQPIRTTTSGQDWATADPGATAPLPKMTPPVSSVTPPVVHEPASAPAAWMARTPAEETGEDSGPLTAGVSFGLAEEHRQSMRGFWFGVIAFILILAVLGLYGWSILPEGGFRNTVQGWF